MKIYPVLPLLSELLSVLCQIQLIIPQCISICEWEVYIYICVHFLRFSARDNHVSPFSWFSVRWPSFKKHSQSIPCSCTIRTDLFSLSAYPNGHLIGGVKLLFIVFIVLNFEKVLLKFQSLLM